MYVLVLLTESPTTPAHDVDHEPFVDSLIQRNAVLLGGTSATEPLPGVTAAYVLRCTDLAEARALVATDPLVSTGAARPTLTAWDLVGINPAAIDPALEDRPDHV